MHCLEIIKARNEECAERELAKKQKERDRVLRELEANGYGLIPFSSHQEPRRGRE